MGTSAFIKLPDGSEAFMKKVNPEERTPSAATAAEQLSAVVAQALGIEHVNTVRVPNSVDTTVSEKVPGIPAVDHFEAAYGEGAYMNLGNTDRLDDIKNAREIGLLDALIQNSDRHANNWMVDETYTAYPIDHGLAFSYSSNIPSPVSPFFDRFFYSSYPGLGEADSLWTKEELEALRGLVEATKPSFEELEKLHWFEDMMDRMEYLINLAPSATENA
jgi:hypothetical protein